MNETFVIGDTHFGHKNILKFCPEHRPFRDIIEHDEELIYRWNSVVRKQDTVIHLGDVAFGRHNIDLVGRLNGIKRLVLGNHDTYPIEVYLKYFTKVYGVLVKNDIILTHVPVHPQQLTRFRANVHGHLHMNYLPDVRYFNVSCERINLTPVRFSAILEQISGQ